MIVQDIIVIGITNYKKTYSDEGFFIRKIGTEEIYEEAIDLLESTYEYEETDKKIEEEAEESDETQPD